MALKDSLRLESIYFNNLKSMMKMLKSWADGTSDEKTKDIIENCIQADAAILLLYRNLGEAWNELMANIQKEMHDLQDLKETVDAYHDELNEKIDEVNNYLMVLIRELQERVTILEQRVDVLETQINIILDLVEDEPVQAKRGKKNTKAANDPTYHLEYHGDTVTYSDIEDMIEDGLDRVIWVRAKEELCHFGIAETNLIRFDRTFYDEINKKVKKEYVSINSSDVVTYNLYEYNLSALEPYLLEIRFDDSLNSYSCYHDNVLLTSEDLIDVFYTKNLNVIPYMDYSRTVSEGYSRDLVFGSVISKFDQLNNPETQFETESHRYKIFFTNDYKSESMNVNEISNCSYTFIKENNFIKIEILRFYSQPFELSITDDYFLRDAGTIAFTRDDSTYLRGDLASDLYYTYFITNGGQSDFLDELYKVRVIGYDNQIPPFSIKMWVSKVYYNTNHDYSNGIDFEIYDPINNEIAKMHLAPDDTLTVVSVT